LILLCVSLGTIFGIYPLITGYFPHWISILITTWGFASGLPWIVSAINSIRDNRKVLASHFPPENDEDYHLMLLPDSFDSRSLTHELGHFISTAAGLEDKGLWMGGCLETLVYGPRESAESSYEGGLHLSDTVLKYALLRSKFKYSLKEFMNDRLRLRSSPKLKEDYEGAAYLAGAIKGAFPNPIGQDAGNEWIKLFNDGSDNVSLQGWFIKDESGKSLQLDGLKIAPYGEIKVNLPKSSIVLNNDRDAVSLYDKDGKLVSKLNYDSPSEDEVVVAPEFQSSMNISSSKQITDSNINTFPNQPLDFSPFVIGFTLALFMGIATGLLIKRQQITINNE